MAAAWEKLKMFSIGAAVSTLEVSTDLYLRSVGMETSLLYALLISAPFAVGGLLSMFGLLELIAAHRNAGNPDRFKWTSAVNERYKRAMDAEYLAIGLMLPVIIGVILSKNWN